MPQYYFHFADGEKEIDKDGVELADEDAARKQALKLAAEMLLQMEAKEFLSHGHWELVVTDQPSGNGRIVMRLFVTATKDDKDAFTLDA